MHKIPGSPGFLLFFWHEILLRKQSLARHHYLLFPLAFLSCYSLEFVPGAHYSGNTSSHAAFLLAPPTQCLSLGELRIQSTHEDLLRDPAFMNHLQRKAASYGAHSVHLLERSSRHTELFTSQSGRHHSQTISGQIRLYRFGLCKDQTSSSERVVPSSSSGISSMYSPI